MVKADELDPGDTTEEEEGKVVGGFVWVADDGVGDDAIEDPTEAKSVAADELETEDLAEEKDDKACEVAEDDRTELEVDDFGGGLVLLHLYSSQRVSEVSSDRHVRSMWTEVRLDEDRDEVHLNLLDCNNPITPICLKDEKKKAAKWIDDFLRLAVAI